MEKKIIRRIILAGIILLATISFSSVGSEVGEKLASWREHILTKGNLGGVEYNSKAYQELIEMGPNCLPDLFIAYRDEQNLHVLYYYEGLIRRIGRFDFFMYSKESLKKNNYELQCTEDIPFLNEEIGENGRPVLPQSLRIVAKRDKLLQWWNQRESFLKRGKVIEKIRTSSGSTRDKFIEYNKTKYRQLSKLHVYGIYNIPYYIDVIEQDNNPIIFCDFLRMIYREEYRAISPTSDVVENTWKVDSKYPTRISKLEIICKWWAENRDKYTKLTDLYKEINQRMEKLCPTTTTQPDVDPNANQ